MSTTRFFSRGLMALLALFLVAGLAFSQNLVVKNGSTFGGTGTYNVKGDITTPGLTQDKSIGGTVNMVKTNGNQTIGTAANGQILTFGTLNLNTSNPGAATVTQEMAGVVVADALSISTNTAFDIQGKTLTIGKLSTITGSGSLDVSDASSVVNYTRADGTGQVVLGLAYAGTLNLSGAGSAKTLSAAGSAKTMTQTGGALSVGYAWSIGTSGTFETVADITAAMSFGASATTASITTLTDISSAANGSLTNNSTTNPLAITTLSGNAGNINAVGAGGVNFTTATNGSGTITASGGSVSIATLSGNSGTIRTTGAGGLSFTGTAANGGTIQGTNTSAGAIAFGNTLTQTTGTVTAGPGNVSFANTVTNDVNSHINAGSGGYVAALDFNAAVGNSGTITLGSQGSATFAGNFTTSGTLALDAASSWTYDGAAQNIAGGATVTYGKLYTAGSNTKTALGDITTLGLFDNGGGGNLNITTDMKTFALVVGGTTDNQNAILKFGGLTNGLAPGTTGIAGGTVVYNGAFANVASQTIAAGSYYQLQFENDAPKNLANLATVTTGSAVSLAAGVPLNIGSSLNLGTHLTIGGGLTLAGTSVLVNNGTIDMTGDLDNSGALTNNGTINVN